MTHTFKVAVSGEVDDDTENQILENLENSIKDMGLECLVTVEETITGKWYIVRSDRKFADGYYGWDANIHSEEQIFEEGDLPYKEGSYENVLVATGEKPTVFEVNEFLCVEHIRNWNA